MTIPKSSEPPPTTGGETTAQSTPLAALEPNDESGDGHKHGSEPHVAVVLKTPAEADPVTTIAGYKIHPLALAFPPLPETELEALVAHISQNGQLHPVIIHEEMILDGRSRASACEHAKISLRTEPLPKGVDPIDYVVGANLRRRQLTPAQRAIVAAKLMPHYQAEAAARKRALSGTRTNPNGSQPEVPEILPEPEECGEAREKAAKATGANARNVTDAVKLQRGAPDLFQAVESATMSIPKALRELEKRGERVEQETSPARDAFLVVLWDDAGAQPTRAPEKSYGSKTYPNIAFFRFYEAGTAKIESAAKHGLNPVAVFSVPVDPTVMIKDKEGRSFCRASCRYLALSVRGSVPEPSKVPGQLIEGGCEGVIKTIELMFPNDLKAISDTNGEPPPGWEHFPRATKADVSQTASGSASNSPKRPEPRSVDVSKVPSSAADSPTAVKKTAAKIENRPAPRKAKLTTVRGHLNKLHHGICSIAVELRRIQDKLPESFHQLDSFRAREQAIPPLEAATQQLASIMSVCSVPGVNHPNGTGCVGEIPFSTHIVICGSSFTRVQRMIEIMIALAQSLRDQAPMIAQELGGLAAELKNTRWNGGL